MVSEVSGFNRLLWRGKMRTRFLLWMEERKKVQGRKEKRWAAVRRLGMTS